MLSRRGQWGSWAWSGWSQPRLQDPSSPAWAGARRWQSAWTSPLGFIVGTCLMGLGNGFGSGIVMTMGADLAPVPGRERFLGWWQGIGNIGSAAGPFAVSALTAGVGLSAGMLATAALGLLGGAWAAIALPCAYAHAGMDMRGRPRGR